MKRIIFPIVAFLISHLSFAQVCSKSQLPTNLQNGLVAFYPFCGNANDESGNGNNGTVNGATLTTDRFGNLNSAYSFSNSTISVPYKSYLSFSDNKKFSVSIWVFTGVNNRTTHYIGMRQPGSSTQFWQLYTPVTSTVKGIAFQSFTGGNILGATSQNQQIPINVWSNIVGTYDNGIWKLYLNGAMIQSSTSTIAFNNDINTLLTIGNSGNFEPFNGRLDDVRIYNRALTECEVQQLFSETSGSIFASSSFNYNVLPVQKSFCGTTTTLDAGSGFASYLWNTGATSQTISATTSGEYRVTVTNASGCAASDTVNVSLVKADILQSDQTVCSNTPLTLSVNSYANQSAKSIDFDNVGLASLDVTGGTAGSVSGVSGNGLSISRPTEVKTKDQTYGYGDYEVDARTGNNTSNQYLSVLLPLNSWTNEAISIDSRPSGTDDVGWGVYVNAVRVAFANGSHPASASNWYKMKIRVTPDSVKCWINSTLLYQGLNTTVPRNIGAVKLSTFSTSHFDNLKYTPYQTFSSVLWSTSATTSTISVTPTATTTYYATISDGISSCTDSVTLTVANIVGFAPLQDTVKVCGDSIVLDAGTGFASYNWNNGATTRAITAKASGSYIATVTNTSGCSASDTSFVSIVKAKILQRDTTICLGNSITLAIDSSSLNKSSACLKSNLPAQLQNGLIAYYPFCGNANDGSGNGINGILFGAPTLVADRFGNSNAAYNFNGTNQYIQTGSISEAITTKTISAWVKLSNMSQMGGGLAAVQSSNGSIFDAVVYNETNSGWGFGSDNLTRTKWSGVKETASEWVMLTATYENNSYKLYRNGVLISSTTQFPITSFGTTSKFNIGLRHNNGGTPYLNGAIDDVYFYNKVLSSSEVLSLYNATAVSWSTGASTNSITVTPTTTTKYFVTVSDGITTCKDSVTVTVSDIGSFNPLQDTVKVCGDSAILDAGAGYSTYKWSNGVTTRIITAKASGKYFVNVANASGCGASDTSIVSIVNANIIQKDTTVCKGSSITLSIGNTEMANLKYLGSIDGKDYYLRDSLMKWPDANQYAKELGGDLYIVRSQRQEDSVYSWLPYKGADKKHYWLGLYQDLNDPNYSEPRGGWKWVDGTPLSYSNWYSGEPNNASCTQKLPENYGQIDWESYGKKWNDASIQLCDDPANGIIGLSLPILEFDSRKILWSTGATTPSIVVNPTVKTTYKVTVSDGITICTDSVVVDVSSSELKVTDPAAVCSPGVVNLTAAAVTAGSATGLTYTYWKDSTATQALVNPDKVSVSGTYYIVGTSATGCTSAPTAVKVTVNPLPVASIVTPTQTTICDKSTLTLSATGGTSYQWLLNGAVIAGATSSTYAASLAGSYEVNVIALGCSTKVAAPVNLSLITAAVPKFSNSSTCIDAPVSFFNETDTTTSGSVSWLWDFGDGQTSTIFNPVYTYKKSGAFIVKLTVTPKLCSSLPVSFTKNITVDIPPVGIKYPNVLAVKNKATPLSARFIANGYSYLWMPSTGLNNGAIQNPVFNASIEQLYRVRLTSPGGCITMDTVKVSVYDSSDIFVPKAFTPNKDGKNDLLQPFLVNITTLKFFRVYNRWGQLMFQTSDSRQGWDGMYNYKPQPLETYTWIAEGIDGNGTTIFRKGQTVLIR